MTAAYRALEGEPAADHDPFQLSLTYSDGRVARPNNWWAPGESIQPPFLVMQGGGGGSEKYNMSYWLHSLPSEGDLEFHCSWGSEGVTYSLWRIEGDHLRKPRSAPADSGRPTKPARQPGARRRTASEARSSNAAAPAPHTAHSPGSNLGCARQNARSPKPLPQYVWYGRYVSSAIQQAHHDPYRRRRQQESLLEGAPHSPNASAASWASRAVLVHGERF
jgi:hypothetical protein